MPFLILDAIMIRFVIGPDFTAQLGPILAPAMAPCRLPVGYAAHAIAGSNQTVRDPRHLSALLYAGQFRVL